MPPRLSGQKKATRTLKWKNHRIFFHNAPRVLPSRLTRATLPLSEMTEYNPAYSVRQTSFTIWVHAEPEGEGSGADHCALA